MKILCSKEQLNSALSVVGRALPSRTPLPVLEGILVEAESDTVRLMATDLRLGVETTFPATVLEAGVTVLPGKLLLDVARRLPEGEVEISCEDTTAHLRCQGSHTSLQMMAAEEYPALPEVESSRPLYLDLDTFRDMIRQTVYAASLDESRPILTGVLLELKGERLRLVALDGFRLALRQCSLGEDYGELQAVCPAHALSEIGKIVGGADDKVRLTLTPTHLMAEVEGVRVVTRLLDGEYIKYRQILPAEWQSRAQIDVKVLSDAIDRASTVAREGRNNLVRLNLSTGEMLLSADSEFGKVQEKVPLALEGEGLEIAFNARYLSDMLKNIDDEAVYLCFNTNISPCVVRPLEGADYLYLVLPVRIYA